MLSEISLFLNSMQGSVLSQKSFFFAKRSDLAGWFWLLVNAIGKTMILSCNWMLFLFFPRTTLSWTLFMAESLPWSADDLDAEIAPLFTVFVYLSVSFSSTKGYVKLRSKEASLGNYSGYSFYMVLCVICYLVYFIHFLSQNSEGSQKVLVSFWQCHVEDWMIPLFVLKIIKSGKSICPSTSSPTITHDVNL